MEVLDYTSSDACVLDYYSFLFHFVEIRRHKCACVHLRLLILHTNNLVNSFVLRTINEDALKDALRAVSTKLRERLNKRLTTFSII